MAEYQLYREAICSWNHPYDKVTKGHIYVWRPCNFVDIDLHSYGQLLSLFLLTAHSWIILTLTDLFTPGEFDVGTPKLHNDLFKTTNKPIFWKKW